MSRSLFFPSPLIAFIFVASCTGGGSTVDTTTGTGTPDAGAPDANGTITIEDEAGTTTKPKDASTPSDGAAASAYPTDNIGTNARAGTKPGNRIANLKFVGYPDANKANGLVTVSLAQFYDPTHTKHRILHIQASGLWESPSAAETKAVATMKAQLDAKEVVWLIAVVEGTTPGTPSQTKDLDAFITNYKAPYTHVLDPGSTNLGAMFDAAALPWNGNIDTRTMEILTSGVGANVTQQTILDDLDAALALAASSTL